MVNDDQNKYKYQYSVLMSVYYKEAAEHLQTAMESIWKQTIPADEFILVCDGPLNKDLNEVIEKMDETHPELLVVRLRKNVGLGNALNIGISYCRNEIIARMDSDDISRPDRCEQQLDVFRKNPKISICSGIVEEFSVSTEHIEARRIPPETHNEIVDFAKKRNPFNHPCVMYKKSAVEAAGGYHDFYLLEDYYLWIRMLQKGSIGYNIQKPLLWMRAGSDMYKRRAGWKYAESQRALFKYMRDNGIISYMHYIESVTIRGVSSIAPNWMRRFVFRKVLRKKGL